MHAKALPTFWFFVTFDETKCFQVFFFSFITFQTVKTKQAGSLHIISFWQSAFFQNRDNGGSNKIQFQNFQININHIIGKTIKHLLNSYS